jgi:hypothetical protein
MLGEVIDSANCTTALEVLGKLPVTFSSTQVHTVALA